MGSYKYLEITQIIGISVLCTEEATLDWILSEVKRLVPTCKAKTASFGGENWHISMKKLQSHDQAIMWWIMQQLCRQGWEPFAVHAVGERGDYVYHHFRLAVSS